MDALSKIFDDIHLEKSEYFYVHLAHEHQFQYVNEPSMLAYVLIQGQCQLQLQHEHVQTLNQGDLIVLPSATPHRIFSTLSALTDCPNINNFFKQHAHETVSIGEPTEACCFMLVIRAKLDIHMAKPLLNALPELLRVEHILGDNAPEWLQIGLHFLALERQSLKPGRDKILDHLVSILLIECVRDYIVNLPDAHNWLNALSHPELSHALAALHSRPEQAWTVESLAEQCCMSRSKFAQVFSQVVGEPPLAYLQKHRLRLAAQYLRDSNLSVQKIAHLVGYNSETAFSQSFKKHFGFSPSQYRQISTQQI